MSQPQVFRKHRIERYGSLVLLLMVVSFDVGRWGEFSHQQTIAIGYVISIRSILYNRYERVTVYENYCVRSFLFLVIPKQRRVFFKHINDIESSTILPGLVRVKIMTSNDKDVALQYFERPHELVHLISSAITSL